jgi:hypothetical protein
MALPDNVRLSVLARRSFTVLAIFYKLDVRLIPFFFRCVCNFEGIISKLLDGVFITLLQGFGFGVYTLDIGRFLQKNDSAPVHPPPVASLGPSIGIRVV